jgi:hypothetical protein
VDCIWNTASCNNDWITSKDLCFGTLCIDGKQFFRQYDNFNQYSFLDYIKRLQRRFGNRKIVFFIDRAHQHCRSKTVRAYLKERNNMLKVVDFAVEECWRQEKHDLLVSKYYPRFTDLKKAIAEYYRTKRFNLDIVKYISRSL